MLRIAIVVYDSCNIILIFYALRFYPSYRNVVFYFRIPLTYVSKIDEFS